MTAASTCSSCGTPLHHDEAEGFCPACMFEGALSLSDLTDATVAESEPGFTLPRLGDYQLLEEIARGGMGVVYKARQISLDRIVAVKLILIGQFADKSAVRRFKAEAAAAAKLRHPNIISIHEIGEEGGQHFFSMEYVEGPSLAELMRQRPVSIREAAELVKTIAEAVQYAHEQGIVHRDLKPSNILIDCFRAPHITDFGLAKDLKTDSDLTLAGQVLGSPNYISPEQSTGQAAGPSSDIYSLGAILYHLLSGRPPFAAETVTDTLKLLAAEDPLAPRLLNPSVPRDLETICLKCLEKEPARRYRTTAALADELGRFLNREPIHGRPISAPAKAWRWCQRKPVVAGLAAAFVLSLLLGLGVSTWQSSARKKALIEARRTLYVAQIQGVQQAWERGDIQKARTLLRAQIPKPGEEDLRGFEWRYLWKLCRDSSGLTLSNAFSRQMVSVAVSPDGLLLASGDRSGQIELRRTSDWTLLEHPMRHSEATRSIQFTANGQSLVTAGDVTVRVWDLATGNEKLSLFFTNRGGSFISCARVSPDGALIAAGTFGEKWVHVWDARRRDTIASFEGRFGGMRFVDFSPDGSKLAFSNGDSMIYVWDVHTRGAPRKIPTPHTIVSIVKFSPDGRILASSGTDDVIRLWSTDDWVETGRLHGHDNIPRTMSFSRDGLLLASGCYSGMIKLWNLSDQTEMQTLYGHSILVEDLAFFPDSKRIASASSDATLKIWNRPDASEAPVFSNAFASASDARFSPDGRFFVTFGVDAPTERKIWDAQSGRVLTTLTNPHLAYHLGEFSPDSRLFAAPGRSNAVFVWSVQDRLLLRELPTGTNIMTSMAFSNEGELFAGGWKDPTIHRWGAGSLEPKERLIGFEGGAGEIKLSPDGEVLAAWCPDGDIRLLELKSLASLPPIPHGGDYAGMSFSLDSKLLAVASEQGTDLWEIRGRKRLAYLQGYSTAFSPDGRYLAVCPRGQFEGSVEQQNSVVLWDLKSRREAARLPWTSGWIFSLTYSPDGRTLISCDNWRTVRLFSTRMGREVLALPRNGAGRTIFSPDGNTLLILDSFGESQLLRASSFAEVEKELAAETAAQEEDNL